MEKYYTVERGDSWASIAKKFYGDARYMQALQEVNDNVTLELSEAIVLPERDVLDEFRVMMTYPHPRTYPAYQHPGMVTNTTCQIPVVENAFPYQSAVSRWAGRLVPEPCSYCHVKPDLGWSKSTCSHCGAPL